MDIEMTRRQLLLAGGTGLLSIPSLSTQELSKSNVPPKSSTTSYPTARELLTGLKSVILSPWDMQIQASDRSDDVPDTMALDTKTELLLRRNKIPFITASEYVATPEKFADKLPSALLTSSIILLRVPGGAYSFFAKVEVMENAFVGRTKKETLCTVWGDGHIGVTGAPRLKGAIADVIERFLDRFANDFLAVNPPKP
jgi:hypothetical protein